MVNIALKPNQILVNQETQLILQVSNNHDGTCLHLIFDLEIPPGLVLIQGDDMIRRDRMKAGETYSHPMVVYPKWAGIFPIVMRGCSYRAPNGSTCYLENLTLQVEAMPTLQTSANDGPEWEISLSNDLRLEEWGSLAVTVSNYSNITGSEVFLRIEGPVDAERLCIPSLAPGGEVTLEMPVRPREPGKKVPVKVKFETKSGVEINPASTHYLSVSRGDENPIAGFGRPVAEPRKTQPGSDGQIKVLFLASDPVNLMRLRIGEEYREIEEKLRMANMADRFHLIPRFSVRSNDFIESLQTVRPRILHFSGHGSPNGGIYIEDKKGNAWETAPEVLAGFLKGFADELKCVLLNACYSKIQADAIAQHIDYVIGIQHRIADPVAIDFTIGFYRALGDNHNIEQAFDLGLKEIEGYFIPNHLTPVLIKKR